MGARSENPGADGSVAVVHDGFFYLDSKANVYACHILPSRLGNLRDESFEAIWHGQEAERYRRELEGCEKCWMVCTAESAMRQNLVQVGLQAASGKLRAHLGLSSS